MRRQCFVHSGSWKEGWARRCRRQNLARAHLRRKFHPRRIFVSRVICYELVCRVGKYLATEVLINCANDTINSTVLFVPFVLGVLSCSKHGKQ